MSTRVRRYAISVASLLAGLLLAVPAWSAVGATGGWTLTASPTSVPLGVPTDISLTATNTAGGSSLGCVEIQLPTNWIVNAAPRIDSTPSGLLWVANPVSGNLVIVRAATDGNILKVDGTSVVFTINVTGTALGSYTWSASSRDKADCKSGIDDAWLSMSVVAAGPVPTAAPTPTGTSTPRPRSTPSAGATAAPSPTATASIIQVPSATPAPSPTAGPSGTPAPAATTASPSQYEPSASGSPSGATPTPDSRSSSAPHPSGDPFVVRGIGGEGGGGDGFSADFASVWYGNGLVWIVPGIALTVPGLLLVLIVAAQAFGGAIWLPLARRRIGEFGIARRRAR